MPPVVIAVVNFAMVAAKFIMIGLKIVAVFAAAHPFVWAAVKIAAALGAAAIAKALSRKKGSDQMNQGTQLALKLDPTMPRQIMLGRAATGGSIVYAYTWTDDAAVPNKYLTRVISLSDWPCSSLVSIREGDTTLAFTGDVTTGLRPCTTHLDNHGATSMWCRVYLGSFTPTADAHLIATEPNSAWTSDHKGVGQCYAIVEYMFDGSGTAFPNGEPQLVFELTGAPIYDQRNDSTRGGRSGSQRLNTPTTWAYSDNTAVILQQVLRGFSINGSLIMGAQADDQDLPDAMLTSAYNACDVSVTNADASTEAKYRSGYIMSSNTSAETAINELLGAMDGDLYDRGGIITILPGVARSTIMALDDTDVNWAEEKSWQPEATLSELYNTVSGSFVSQADGYTQKPFPIRTNSTWITDDGGERIVLQRDYAAVIHNTQAQRLSKRLHLKSRYQGTIGFVGPLWLLELEQGDWFTMTSVQFGFTAKTFEVRYIGITADLQVAIVAREIDSSIDTYVAATSQVTLTDTPVSPSDPPTNILSDVQVHLIPDTFTGVSADNFVSIQALQPDGSYSTNVGLGVNSVSFYNNAGAVWQESMRVIDGNVLFNGNLDVSSNYRLTSGAPWPTGLASVDYLASDGDVITFGTDLINVPVLSINLAVANLPQLATGDAYNIYAEDLTSTGFTFRARQVTPGTPTARTGSTGTGAHGTGPLWQADKTVSQDAYNQYYTINLTGTIRILKTVEYYGGDPKFGGGGTYNSYTYGMVVELWYYDGSWHSLGTQTIIPSFTDSGWGDGTYHDISWTLAVSAHVTAALGSGGKFGASVYSYTYAQDVIDTMPAATWLSQTLTDNGSATPNGEQLIISVTPKAQ